MPKKLKHLNFTRSHESQQLEYDHNKNSDLELLDRDTEYDSDDLFTFNAHEIYISDNHDQDFDRNYEDYGEQIDEKNDNFEAFDGFGSDDLFFPQNNLKRSSYDKVPNNIISSTLSFLNICFYICLGFL